MATEKWVNGATNGWAVAFGTELNGLSAGNAVLSSVSVTNGTNLDMFADLSVANGMGSAPAFPAFLGFYLYPLASDGATFGDGRFGSATAAQPLQPYYIGQIQGAATGGTTSFTGALHRIAIPPGTFSFLVLNKTGSNLATSGSSSSIKYRTYNRSSA